MERARGATIVIALAVLSACSGSTTSTPIAPSLLPVAPTPVPPSAGPGHSTPAGPGQGTIAIRELSPAGGATLAVRGDCRVGDATRICTDTWRGAFDVMVDREMTNAVLTVRFYDGQTICGYGAAVSNIVPAGQQVSFSVAWIALSDQFGTFTPPCRLPATIDRMEVELWSDWSSWTNTLIQNFAVVYTFSER